MIELAVLADDFTGALDTGVQFSSHGIDTLVCNANQFKCCNNDVCSVLVINLNTRHESPQNVQRIVYDAACHLKKMQIPNLYLKVDSGLRGNIGASLEAVIAAWQAGIVMAPSYPDMGRIMRGGILYVNGCPVAKSVFASDLFNPVRHSCVSHIIAEQSDLSIVYEYSPEKQAVVLKDAETNVQMLEIAQEACANGYSIFSGCAAFAACLAKELHFSQGKAYRPLLSAPMVVLSGSTSSISLKQFEIAEKKGFHSIFFQDVLQADPDLSLLAQAVCTSGHSGILIRIPKDPLSEIQDRKSWTLRKIGQRIATNLGKAARAIEESGFNGTLLVVGGDTLDSVLTYLQATEIRPKYEIHAGVVVSEMLLPNQKRRILISKSGSFGSEDVIGDIYQRNMVEAMVQ